MQIPKHPQHPPRLMGFLSCNNAGKSLWNFRPVNYFAAPFRHPRSYSSKYVSRWTRRNEERGESRPCSPSVRCFSLGNTRVKTNPPRSIDLRDGDGKSSSWLVQKDAEKRKEKKGWWRRWYREGGIDARNHAYLTLERGRRGPR